MYCAHRVLCAATCLLVAALCVAPGLTATVKRDDDNYIHIRKHTALKRLGIRLGLLERLAGSRAAKSSVCVTDLSFLNLGNGAIPAEYHVHEEHPECAATVRNQGECGSCWAFASAGVLEQRMCLASEDINGNFQVSPQHIVTCGTQCYNSNGQTCSSGADCRCPQGCDGGYPDIAFKFLGTDGGTPEQCVEYQSSGGDDPLTCAAVEDEIETCAFEDASSNTTFVADQCYYLPKDDLETVQRDIMANGPVQATYVVYDDFYDYKSGVYTCPSSGGTQAGYHAVIIVGWGVEDDTSYWLVQNSWGSGWGDDGYFKIRRGTNECGIEDYLSSIVANVDGMTYQSEVKPNNATAANACWLTATLVVALVMWSRGSQC